MEYNDRYLKKKRGKPLPFKKRERRIRVSSRNSGYLKKERKEVKTPLPLRSESDGYGFPPEIIADRLILYLAQSGIKKDSLKI